MLHVFQKRCIKKVLLGFVHSVVLRGGVVGDCRGEGEDRSEGMRW